MKRASFRLVAIICAVTLLLMIPVHAAEQASDQLSNYDAYPVHVGNGRISCGFDVTATGYMAKVGVTDIIVYEKLFGEWMMYYSFSSTQDEYESQMISTGDYFHSGTVYCPGYTGGQFKVVTYFYAEDYNGGSDYRTLTDYVNT